MAKKEVIKNTGDRFREINVEFGAFSVKKLKASVSISVGTSTLTPDEARQYLLNAQLQIDSIKCATPGDDAAGQTMLDGTDADVEIGECVAECHGFGSRTTGYTATLSFVKSAIRGRAASFVDLAGRSGTIKCKRIGDAAMVESDAE